MNESTTRPIQLLIHDGPKAGQRLFFERGPITFGRAADNAMVLDDGHVSRHHGEILFENNQWILTHRGHNLTRVNGKALRNRPHPLVHQDIVSIGEHACFQVILPSAPATADHGGEDERVEPDRPRLTRRGQLWIWIGLLATFWIVVITFLLTLFPGQHDPVAHLSRLHAGQIRRIIGEVPSPKPPFEARAQEYLEKARSLHDRLDARPDKLFDTYQAYREAMAHLPRQRLVEGRDMLQYEGIRRQLVEEIIHDYNDAYGKLKSHQYEEAYKAFEQLMKKYPDQRSDIYQNLAHNLSVARRRLEASAKSRRKGLF